MIRQYLERIVRKALKDEAAAGAMRIMQGLGTSTPSYSGDEYAAALKQYSFACMQKRALGVGAVKNYLAMEKADESFDPIKSDHWAAVLFKQPNKITNMTWQTIKTLLTQWLDYNGNAYLWLPQYGTKYPLQMWVLPSTATEIVPGKERMIDKYKVKVGGGYLEIDAAEVCHLRTYGIDSDMRYSLYQGKPIMIQALVDAIKADAKMAKYIFDYFDRDAVPPLLYKTKHTLDISQWTAIKDHLTQALGDKVKIIPIENDSETESLQSVPAINNSVIKGTVSEDVIKRIAAGFGVPYAMITSEYDNRAASETIYADFMNNTIEPL